MQSPQSISLVDLDPEDLLEGPERVLAQGSGSRNREADAREIVLIRPRRIDPRGVHRGGSEQDGDAMFLDGSERGDRLESLDEDSSRAVHHRQSQRHVETKDVEQGKAEEHDVLARDLRIRDAHLLVEVRGEVSVREHHALGFAGRARGIGEHGDVIVRGVDVGRFAQSLGRCGPRVGRDDLNVAGVLRRPLDDFCEG